MYLEEKSAGRKSVEISYSRWHRFYPLIVNIFQMMTYMKKACVILLVLLGLLVNVGYSQKPAVVGDNDPGWKRIGQVTASFKKQSESISVLGADEFTAIKLKVSEAPISIERVQVFYESGDMEELDVRSKLEDGSETATLKLTKPYRDIKKVAFTYKTLPNTDGEKADLELFGLKTDQEEHSDSYLEKKAENADEDIDEAARETKEDVKEAGREVEEEAEEAGREVEEEAEETEREAEEAEREVEQEAKEAENEFREESREAEREAEETEGDVERAIENTGDDISEAAAKAMADIKDRRHQTKVGPKGQIIFITDEGVYYYIDNEGKKVFVKEIELKDKPDDN